MKILVCFSESLIYQRAFTIALLASMVWKVQKSGIHITLDLEEIGGYAIRRGTMEGPGKSTWSLEKTTDNCEERLILIKIVYQYSFCLRLRHAWVMENGMGIWRDCVKDTSNRSRLREILVNVEY